MYEKDACRPYNINYSGKDFAVGKRHEPSSSAADQSR
jgi:hypothetical protein